MISRARASIPRTIHRAATHRLLRQAKRIPENEELDGIAGVTKERVKGLLTKSLKLVWLLFPIISPLTDLLALI